MMSAIGAIRRCVRCRKVLPMWSPVNRKYCADCRPAATRENQHAWHRNNWAKRKAVYARWYVQNRKHNPAWRAENKRRARAWRTKNRERVIAYLAARKVAAGTGAQS